jgi:hypothetical protein
MAVVVTTLINCPVGVWTQITTDEVNLSVLVKKGGVVTTMALSPPVGFDENTPIKAKLPSISSTKVYFGIPVGSIIYAYATSEDSVLTIDPAV